MTVKSFVTLGCSIYSWYFLIGYYCQLKKVILFLCCPLTSLMHTYLWFYWKHRYLWFYWMHKYLWFYWKHRYLWFYWMNRYLWFYWKHIYLWFYWIHRYLWFYWIHRYLWLCVHFLAVICEFFLQKKSSKMFSKKFCLFWHFSI